MGIQYGSEPGLVAAARFATRRHQLQSPLVVAHLDRVTHRGLRHEPRTEHRPAIRVVPPKPARSHAMLTPSAHPPPGKPEAHRNTTART